MFPRHGLGAQSAQNLHRPRQLCIFMQRSSGTGIMKVTVVVQGWHMLFDEIPPGQFKRGDTGTSSLFDYREPFKFTGHYARPECSRSPPSTLTYSYAFHGRNRIS